MIKITQTDSENPDFQLLVKKLDAYLKDIDGDEHDFYNQFNHINTLKHTVVAYLNNKPIACGAFKEFDEKSVEIKRMYTEPEHRKSGAGKLVLNALENWANSLGYKATILETGSRQVEAVNFYNKNNYNVIPNYGQYKQVLNSICFKKMLNGYEKGQ